MVLLLTIGKNYCTNCESEAECKEKNLFMNLFIMSKNNCMKRIFSSSLGEKSMQTII